MKFRLAIAALALLAAPFARADGFIVANYENTYTYFGHPMSACDCAINGQLTLVASLQPYESPIFPVSYSFTDGLMTLTPANSTFKGYLSAFPGTSSIDLWAFDIESLGGYLFSEFYGSAYEATDSFGTSHTSGFLEGNKGTWALTSTVGIEEPIPTSTPEPPAILMTLCGLSGLLWLGKRKA